MITSVFCKMSGAGQRLEVVEAVVELIPVDVVDDPPASQRPMDRLPNVNGPQLPDVRLRDLHDPAGVVTLTSLPEVLYWDKIHRKGVA